jgi:hypothetical protein
MSMNDHWGNAEGWCSEGHYTTDITSNGECREHEGVEVTEEREET